MWYSWSQCSAFSMKNARTIALPLAVEVDGRAPGGPVPGREVVGAELGQVVAVGAEVVVDHVEQHRQAQAWASSTSRRRSSGRP